MPRLRRSPSLPPSAALGRCFPFCFSRRAWTRLPHGPPTTVIASPKGLEVGITYGIGDKGQDQGNLPPINYKCHILCGTLGKLANEVSKGTKGLKRQGFNPSKVKYFIIDEADALLAKQNSRDEIEKIRRYDERRCGQRSGQEHVPCVFFFFFFLPVLHLPCCTHRLRSLNTARSPLQQTGAGRAGHSPVGHV